MIYGQISPDLYQQDSQRTLRGEFIMVNMNSIREEMKKELAFTEEQRELELTRKMLITFDEDCPEKAIKFRGVNPPCGLAGNSNEKSINI